MKNLRRNLLGAAAAIALGSFAGNAQAAIITFTWDPAAMGGIGASSITADNLNFSDFAVTTIDNATGNFSETGVLRINAFLQGSTTVLTPGLNSTYQLYYTFTATGHLPGWNPGAPNGVYVGTFNTINYALLLDPNKDTTASITPTTVTVNDASSNDITLATGSKMNGQLNQVTLVGGIPGANTSQSFVPDAGATAFFVSPAAADYITLKLEDSFINTPGVASFSGNATTTYLEINGGGGNADLAKIPEPATLSLLGGALLGLGVASKRRRKANA